MCDRIGIRSFLVGEGDVDLETLILQGFAERTGRNGTWVHQDQFVMPLIPRDAFPDDGSRAAYFAFMEGQLRQALEGRR